MLAPERVHIHRNTVIKPSGQAWCISTISCWHEFLATQESIMLVQQCHKPSPIITIFKWVGFQTSKMDGLWHCYPTLDTMENHNV